MGAEGQYALHTNQSINQPVSMRGEV
jgi:hypothetical protein